MNLRRAIGSVAVLAVCAGATVSPASAGTSSSPRIAFDLWGIEGGVSVINADGSGFRLVGDGADVVIGAPKWSSENGWLGYISENDWETVGRASQWIYVTKPERFDDAPISVAKDRWASFEWRPGRAQIAAHGLNLVKGEVRSAVFGYNTDGRKRFRIRGAGVPSWSYDGRFLSFERGGSIWLADASGNELGRLARGHSVQWSPVGHSLLFSGRNGLRRINAAGDGRQWLAKNFSDFAWSPDGSTIAYTKTKGQFAQDAGVRLIGADGSNRRSLTDRGAFEAWTPDSNRVLWSIRKLYDQGRVCNDVNLIEVDGENNVTLIDDTVFYEISGFTANSRHLLATTEESEITMIDADGTGFSVLTQQGHEASLEPHSADAPLPALDNQDDSLSYQNGCAVE